jgi:hypothetical protein
VKKTNFFSEEDKRREARLYQQKVSGDEDVDSLLTELRRERTGRNGMARTASNVFDSPSSSERKKGSKAKGGRRQRAGDVTTSVSKDAAVFLESKPRNARAQRSRRLGGAAVSWLDSSPAETGTKDTGRKPPSNKSPISSSTTISREDSLGRKSSLARRAGKQALDNTAIDSVPITGADSTVSASSDGGKSGDTDMEDIRRSNATSIAAQEAMKTAEQAHETKESESKQTASLT